MAVARTIRTVDRLFLALVLGALASCLEREGFECDDDAQCDLDGQEGVCVESRYCAYPDDECPSELRYEDHAPGVGGRCVPPNPGAGTTSGGGSAGDEDESSG